MRRGCLNFYCACAKFVDFSYHASIQITHVIRADGGQICQLNLYQIEHTDLRQYRC